MKQLGMTMVGRDGKIVDQPPLHIHHAKFNIGGSWFKQDDFAACLLGSKNDCRRPLYSIAGDDECTLSTGGMSCLTFNMPSGFGLAIEEPIGFYAYMNDVRKRDSPSLEWYIEMHSRV